MTSGIMLIMLNSVEESSGWRGAGCEGEGDSVDGTSDPTPAEAAAFDALRVRPPWLTAQMIDDTSQAPPLYTLKQTMCQEVSQPWSERERQNV